MTQTELVRYPECLSLGFDSDETGPEADASTMTLLEAINDEIAGYPTLRETVDYLFDETRDLFPCDRIGVAFFEEGGARISSYYNKAGYEKLRLGAGFSQDVRGSSLSKVLERGTPRIIPDLEAYLEAHPHSSSTRLLVEEGVRSNMTCPLFVDDRVVGLMFRSSKQKDAYRDHHAARHAVITRRLSQAVEKAYRIDQLDKANRAYSEMLGFVAHELKSPIASMVTDAELLQQGYLGELAKAQQDKLGAMIEKAHFLLGLIGEYLDLARVESGELGAEIEEGVDFETAVVDMALRIVEPQLQAKQMTLEKECDPAVAPLRCDPKLMRIAVLNLIGNAVKYGDDGGRVRLKLQAFEGALRFSVWNSGPGFPEEQKSKLFKKFSRIDSKELKRRKGTGVGLYTTWRIVNLHSGRIWAESKPGQWAEFHMEV